MVLTFWHNMALDEESFRAALIKLIVADLSLTLAILPLKFDPLSISSKDSWVDKALVSKIDKLINWSFEKEKYG